ncbi:hypothetical protein BD410DRAFT_839981 [Rickenella mellea]|uniref:Alpha/gamma-adaptin-binding protein p34 n=1 Tax=Rickenella mellea TaxID=50990 RepID=A0A4Y7Q5T7_9AGAM|nr:hypothetical protein BD410DRAFT_839981 [Rickenella mellea]
MESSSCRILIVASSVDLGRGIAYRIRDLSGSNSSAGQADNETSIIPWKIANKYYTADVHFKVVPHSEWNHYELEGVPALIYAWSDNEQFNERIVKLSEDIEEFDLEVSLAIRAGSTPVTEDAGVEDFVSDRGFEFIDASGQDTPISGLLGDSSDDGGGAPGLHRAMMALSTIMWPNLVQSSSLKKKAKAQPGNALQDSVERGTSSGLVSLLASVHDTEDGVSRHRDERLRKEMEELERWLEEDDTNTRVHSNDDDPWRAIPSIMTPIIAISLSSDSVPEHPTPTKSGFDDDFSDYVSAPATLQPMNTGASYSSLHSLSDVDEFTARSDAEMEDAELDDDLPSREEIKTATERIFDQGHSPLGDQSQSDDRGDSDFDTFDLSRVLGALQLMKEEIAGIDDEGEKRKAAAKVALGLVYGLHGDFDEHEEQESQDETPGST